jgi:hypothetical protein
MKPKHTKYFNYVKYARKLQSMEYDELQAEFEWRKVMLRMVEQEQRARRENQKRIPNGTNKRTD